jgi:ClpP class serine protease
MIPVRILRKFFCEPWLIRSDIHQAMGEALVDYLDGPRARTEWGPDVPFQPKAETALKGVKIDQGYAMIDIAGTIGKHLSMLEMMCAEGYDMARLEDAIVALQGRRDVHTIVFRFNSPGGTAAGVGDVAAMIRDLGENKRTVGYLDVEAASAAYWLASACREIYAPASAVVGSISAYIALLDQTAAMTKKGYAMNVFRDGELKGIGLKGKALTNMEKEFLQARVNAVGGAFKRAVVAYRPGISRGALDGRWMDGEEAVEAGLIDGVVPSVHHLLARLMEEKKTADAARFGGLV